MELVTIAIPIYNSALYLEDTIQSVINQTYKEWILFLINDGSTDESLSIMQRFAVSDSRIRIINDGQNKGLISRLNQSISMTNTKYYARMDADDIMYIDRIEKQVSYLESHPNIDVLGSSIMKIDNNNNIIGSGYSAGKVSGFVHPTVMGKTEWFQSNLYNDWALRAEDSELWLRTSSTSEFWALDTPLLFYREFGVPSLHKTLLSLKTMIKIYSHYQDYNKTLSWYIKNVVMTYIKMLIYLCGASVGKMNYVISKRRRIPVPENLCLSKEHLDISIAKSFNSSH